MHLPIFEVQQRQTEAGRSDCCIENRLDAMTGIADILSIGRLKDFYDIKSVSLYLDSVKVVP